ncbi:MAG: hypothetical protein NTX03_09780, partial [Bacteroidetes bacterium]|nr:hypothetical protein [Bacteroidota bacterium]
MAQEIKRRFKGSDDDFLLNAQTLCTILGDDLADFTARFPYADAAWKDELQADIDAAEAQPSDFFRMGDKMIVTDEIKTLLITVKIAFKNLNTYAGLAFAKDDVNSYVQGKDLWREGKNKTLRIANALALANTYAENADIKPALLNKGYTQVDIDELATLSTTLFALIKAQSNTVKTRQVGTQSRILQLNAIYKKLQEIGKMVKVIWAADATKTDQYHKLIYKKKVFTTITVSVLDSETEKPLVDAVVNIPAFPK